MHEEAKWVPLTSHTGGMTALALSNQKCLEDEERLHLIHDPDDTVQFLRFGLRYWLLTFFRRAWECYHPPPILRIHAVASRRL